MDFRALPSGKRITLDNLTIPACVIGEPGDLITVSLTIEDGMIVDGEPGERVDMGRAMAFPAFTDMHTHLDKGHIWPRASNPDGTFMGALTTVGDDRTAHWSAEDVRARMAFSLKCAYAHGTRAIRTHLDSIPPQPQITWPVFAELRDAWAGKIDLQAVCLVACENVTADGPFKDTADIVAEHTGVLGMVSYPNPDLEAQLNTFFEMAGTRGLEADFHSDETNDPASATLRQVAEAVIRTGFDAPVVVGHCCSLAVQDEAEALKTLDLVAEAGLSIVSLPMCNLYLQDRVGDRTPRWRGITMVHEMKARGINVAFASDNTRDPFYAYGDLDMVEVMREATRIGHLDHSREDWASAFTCTPTDICGFPIQDLEPGYPADMVIFNARSWTELFARPQSDRIVLRKGEAIDRTLPAYSDLDHLMEIAS